MTYQGHREMRWRGNNESNKYRKINNKGNKRSKGNNERNHKMKQEKKTVETREE